MGGGGGGEGGVGELVVVDKASGWFYTLTCSLKQYADAQNYKKKTGKEEKFRTGL